MFDKMKAMIISKHKDIIALIAIIITIIIIMIYLVLILTFHSDI